MPVPDGTMTAQANLNSAGTTAYEQLAYFALRDALYFDFVPDIKPTRQSHRGSTVVFNIYDDLPPAVTPLPETSDVSAVAVTDDTITLAIDEYGNAAVTTALARGTSYLMISEDVANVVGYNAGLSLDCLARNPLLEGDNLRFANSQPYTLRSEILASDHLTATDIRAVHTEMSDYNVQPYGGGFYMSFISPRVSKDLREETGEGNWRTPREYVDPGEIKRGEIGEFEGFRFVETPRLTPRNLETTQGGPGGFVGGGAGGTVDVFPTLFCGRQAASKTWASLVSRPIPAIRLGTIVDSLGRFVPVGWYWLGGYGRFREEALWRVESASSVQET